MHDLREKRANPYDSAFAIICHQTFSSCSIVAIEGQHQSDWGTCVLASYLCKDTCNDCPITCVQTDYNFEI